MPPKLTIKIPSLGAKLAAKLLPKARRAAATALPKIAALVVDRVTAEAQTTLHEMAPEYIKALHDPSCIKLDETGLTITLTGVARDLEKGTPSFDIKAKMLKHATKFSKSGKPYIDVPFQHGTPKAKTIQAMPTAVHNAMRAAVQRAQSTLSKSGASPAEASTATARLRQTTPGKVFDRKLRIGGKTVNTTVEHKRGIYDDMIRTAHRAGDKTVGQYRTVRRISPASNATSWWHPGFRGANLFKKVLPKIKSDMRAIVRDSFRAEGLKVTVK